MNSTPSLVARAKALVADPVFDVVMMSVILVNAVVLGVETFQPLADAHRGLFGTLNNAILGIYVVELLIRITACGWNPREFVKDGWNIFDFLVVVASLLPWLRENAMLLRLIRLLRIVRIVRFLPDLRVIVAAVGRSVPGVASLAAGTVLLIYIYGMIGWVLFSGHDPDNYGNIGVAMLTMFLMLTLENLPDNIAMGLEISPWTVVFFVSYAVLASFLIFNLFIGIVLNSMEEARSADRKEHETDDLLARLRAARTALEEAETELAKTHRRP
ncbi:ion transporter [Mycobacterium sp. ITM-2016-00316]|uniref:ion transporter n=1 Tax=Mycobacterium sp. ITM-2016-00316 TaxID=2099695 RepID=UPI001E50DDD0|nr:ion transporter [Mycobacterium sp. ITM-2016-00316]WNG81194.1 ion transporter [Mycobacterium sp. ITM-2016-00316]